MQRKLKKCTKSNLTISLNNTNKSSGRKLLEDFFFDNG